MADGLFSGFDPSRLYNVLKEQELLPQTARQVSPESGNPAYYRDFNFLYTGEAQHRDTVAHEMTHAVQHNIIRATAETLEKKDKKTKQELQFLDAYQKLMAPDGMVKDARKTQANKAAFNKTAAALYGKPVETRYDRYRTSPTETQAWGVGAHSNPNRPLFRPQPHMDASYTTEFDMLLSMYDKLPSQLKQASAVKRKEDLTFSKNWFKEQRQQLEGASELNELFSDPFAPTVN
jgi:hypothetical protein